MLSFLQYVLALLLTADLAGATGDAAASADWTAAITGLATGIGVAAAAGLFASALAKRDGASAVRTLRLVVAAGRVLSLGAFYLFAQKHGGRSIDAALGVDAWPGVSILVRLAPFLLLRVAWKASLHPAWRTLDAGPDTLREQLLFDGRQALLPLAPIVVIGAVQQLLAQADAATPWGRVWLEIEGAPAAAVLASLLLVAVLLLLLPFALRIAWRAYPMPKGHLRTQFENYAKRVGLHANDILVWPTGGGHMNAAVIGALPGFRYVFITDSLLDTLREDEILAVFAHEAGHAKRQHLPLLLGFTSFFAFAGLLPASLGDGVGDLLAGIPPVLRVVLFVLLFLGLVLGWVSRRLEQEADVYALDTIPTPPVDSSPGESSPAADHPLARALDHIAEESGAAREQDSWRHFSIGKRVTFIRAFLADPAVRRSYRLKIAALRVTLAAAIVFAVTVAVLRLPRDLAESRTQRVLVEVNLALLSTDDDTRAAHYAAAARAAVRAHRPEDALRWFRAAATLSKSGRADLIRDWEPLLRASGRTAGADLLASSLNTRTQ